MNASKIALTGRKSLIAAIGVALLLSACSSGDGKNESSDNTTTTVETTTSSTEPESTTTEAPANPNTVGEVPDQTSGPTSAQTSRLTNVELQGKPNAGTLVFTFDGAVPGYNIGYTTLPPRQDGSGNPVALRGNDGLAIRFSPSADVDLTGGVNRTYTGPERMNGPAGSNVAEVAKVSSYEQSLVWAAGVNRKANFDVRTQQNPSRVIIELRP